MARRSKTPANPVKPTQIAAPTLIVKSGNDNQDMQELTTAKEGDVSFNHKNGVLNKVVENAEISEIDVVKDVYGFNDKAKQLAFLEEPVTINIHETNDVNQEPLVFLSINGMGAMPANNPYVPRGVDVVVKRKFVEKLMRARPTRYQSKERFNSNGEKEYYQPSTTALLYPFSVIRDENPRGNEWRRKIMAERA